MGVSWLSKTAIDLIHHSDIQPCGFLCIFIQYFYLHYKLYKERSASANIICVVLCLSWGFYVQVIYGFFHETFIVGYVG